MHFSRVFPSFIYGKFHMILQRSLWIPEVCHQLPLFGTSALKGKSPEALH